MDRPDPSTASVILDNLPGFPDNLTRGPDGRLWAGLTGPRSPVADRLAHWPQLRRLLMGLPTSLWPLPPAYGHVFAFDERGQVLQDLQDPAAAIPATSGATETADGVVFVQSLEAAAIGRLEPRGWTPQGASLSADSPDEGLGDRDQLEILEHHEEQRRRKAYQRAAQPAMLIVVVNEHLPAPRGDLATVANDAPGHCSDK